MLLGMGKDISSMRLQVSLVLKKHVLTHYFSHKNSISECCQRTCHKYIIFLVTASLIKANGVLLIKCI